MSALINTKHILELLAALTLAFLWTRSQDLNPYTYQLISFLILMFLSLQVVTKKLPGIKRVKNNLDFGLLTAVVFLVVFTSGGLLSPFFWLVYFLLFATALLFDAPAALGIAAAASVLFILNASVDIIREIIILSSLFLITPLTLYFASQYKKVIQNQQQIDYLKHEEKILTGEVINQETAVKKWTSQELKIRLAKIWENLDRLSRDNSLSDSAKNKLEEISNQMRGLLQSGERLKNKIEK